MVGFPAMTKDPTHIMTWHLIEGEAGCAYAVRHGCVAVVVDALRASATAAMLLHHGATEVLTVADVADAHRAKESRPDALMFGERGGLPPEGFDYGNSPQEAHHAAGREVIFTTTTGAGRMVAAWGAEAVYMGTTVNADAVAKLAGAHGKDVVVIPAGLATDPTFDAQEDWVAAAHIASLSGADIGEGNEAFALWCERIEAEGVDRLFDTAPHADKLRAVQLDSDIGYCAKQDLTDAVPQAVARDTHGVLVRNAERS